ncbi:photosystem II S4 domain protein [Halobacteroides halobius DSM 5150]|uniref:Photosystem II S4 domain protein n=1 Tax=Halobacteroides halobius (strain ATCC 35273 / DSM 5150 / MD-1) TaxID=748449 RepID=L0K910_HALHC|nr:photosystem II S4 domain protein [Halobacteroides halobius]AGB40819.1 photosystem II S4 domain protein [Halobacteroides halobius DSM 5150]
MFNKEKLLSHLDSKEASNVDKILDKAELALIDHKPTFTDFLNPRQLYIAKPVLAQIRDLKYLEYGGYNKAERKMLALVPDYYIPDMIDPPLTVLNITGQFKFQQVSHRDFLGAILGTGIKRKKVGDLVLYKKGCQAIIAEQIKDFIMLNLEQVHQIGVQVEEISTTELRIEPQRTKEIRDTVASLRLDSVASSGFSTSRSKMSKQIEKGSVKVNWKIVDDTSYMVDTDDILSIRGRGRVEIDEILGKSRRGRIKLRLKRYL